MNRSNTVTQRAQIKPNGSQNKNPKSGFSEGRRRQSRGDGEEMSGGGRRKWSEHIIYVKPSNHKMNE